MQLVCIPESFSPSLSSARLEVIVANAAKAVFPDVTVKGLQTEMGVGNVLESFRAAMGGQYVVMPVMGLCGVPVSARYLSAGDTAVVAATEAAGMQLRQPGFGALNTTSYGVGELIGHALSAGHKHVIVSLTGIATADAGCGIAAALGVRFINRQGQPFLPMGATLTAIDKIAPNHFFLRPHAHTITVLADTTDSLNNPQALLNAIGMEPGVEPQHLTRLTDGLRHLAETVRRQGGEKLMGIVGGLAGGAAAAGMRGMLRVEINTDGPAALIGTAARDHTLAEADMIVAVLPEVTEATLAEGGALDLPLKPTSEDASRPVVLFTRRLPTAEVTEALYAAGVTAIYPLLFTEPTEQTVFREDDALKVVLDNTFRLLKEMRRA